MEGTAGIGVGVLVPMSVGGRDTRAEPSPEENTGLCLKKSSRRIEARPCTSFSPSLYLSSRLVKVPSSHTVTGSLQQEH